MTPVSYTIPIPYVPEGRVVAAAKLIKGDWSLRYWDEMTRPNTPVAHRVMPPGGTICTVGSGVISGIDLEPGERGVVWMRDSGVYAIAAKLVVGGKRYLTSSDPAWVDPEPGSIRSRPSTYAPPATTTADAPA